jgi:AmmeMemoRadiSam system protein B
MRRSKRGSGWLRSTIRKGAAAIAPRSARWALALMSCLVIVAAVAARSHGTSRYVSPQPSHPLRFYDAHRFRIAVRQAAQWQQPSLHGRALGGVVPHHLPASYLVARFFHAVARQRQPATIIVIGPNHRQCGGGPMLTTRCTWETPFGLLRPNQDMIEHLVQREVVRVEDPIFAQEHSIATLVPFIKFYLPQTRIVPILIDRLDARQVRRLANGLAAAAPGDALLVASVDFSHYLPRRQAEQKDRRTLALVRDFDTTRLLPLDSDYLDCPGALAALMLVMQQRGATHVLVWGHDNSGAMVGDDAMPTTGYYCLAFAPRPTPAVAAIK